MRTETEFERIVRQADWYASVDASSGLAHHLKAYWPEIKAEITKLRAERDAAARDMRERCAKALDALSRHACSISGVENVRSRAFAEGARDIRALPDTPTVIATEGDAS